MASVPLVPVPLFVGLVVVVVVEAELGLLLGAAAAAAAALVWFSSSSTSFASAAFSVDWADETDSLRAVVSSVPSVWPAVTASPGVAVKVATWPAHLERGGGVADGVDVAHHWSAWSRWSPA